MHKIFGILLTVHRSIFISVINQLDAQNFWHFADRASQYIYLSN